MSTTISPIGASATDVANGTSQSTVIPVTEIISTISTVVPETEFKPSSTFPSVATDKPETESSDAPVTTSPEGIEISFPTDRVTTDADAVSSVITEASIATDGLETESPGITISSFVTEATSEGVVSDVTDPSVTPSVTSTSSLDITTTTESVPSSGEPMLTEASVATEEPETEATIGIVVDITSSPTVASSSVTSVTSATDSPLTEPTDSGYATEATISVTESTSVTDADVQISTEKPGVTDSIEGQVTTKSTESTSEYPGSSETTSAEILVSTEVSSQTASEVPTEVTDIPVSTELPSVSASTEVPFSTESAAPQVITEVSATTGAAGETSVSTETTSTVSSVTSALSTEAPFPPFPGTTSSVYPKPETTTWKPSTTTELIIGPGACVFDGEVYLSAQQIPRDDPCDFCFCFRGDIICLQQSCPPPIPGCYEEAIPGFCCPRYECPVTQAVVNITTTTTPIPTYPPVQKVEEFTVCEIGGRFYHPGELVEEASGPCLECR